MCIRDSYDSVFTGILEEAGGQLLTITDSATRIVSDANCQVLKDPLEKTIESAKNFFLRIDELRKYVGIAAYKRGLLLEKFNRSMELAIYRSHANAVGQDLDHLLAELGAMMNLDSLLWEVTDWWLKASVNGLADRLHTKYLQYRKPLQILASEMSRANAFKKRIKDLAGLDDITKSQAVAIVDDHAKDIQSQIDFVLKRGGWAGNLEAQKQMASRRIALVPGSNTLCHQTTDIFFDLAGKSNSIESYELAEAKYKEHVDHCVKE